jgi:hypothetical protein
MAMARTSFHQPPASSRGRQRVVGARARAVAAQRLVGDGDQHQHGGADHQREHAEVEEQRAGERHLADQRQSTYAKCEVRNG